MTTIRNPKAIQTKSRTHEVAHVANAVYHVTSGHSGATYRVTLLPIGGATCSCDWSKYRPASNGGKCGCSHVVSVMNFIAGQDDRKVMAWSNADDAKRQHRPTVEIGDGVTLTTRKVGA